MRFENGRVGGKCRALFRGGSGSKALRDQITAMGNKAAHIVPSTGFAKRNANVVAACDDARTALRKANIGVNDAVNGLWT